jgi:aspartate racemase
MHTHPLSAYSAPICGGDWARVGQLVFSSARILARAGAAFAICPDNTAHLGLDSTREAPPIPFIHIADVVVLEARGRGFQSVGVIGTQSLMRSSVYKNRLAKVGLEHQIPDDAGCERIDRLIMSELVKGKLTEVARLYFSEVIERLKSRGCDAVILGCTEIPLLLRPDDCPLPTLDSTQLLARAALRESLKPD